VEPFALLTLLSALAAIALVLATRRALRQRDEAAVRASAAERARRDLARETEEDRRVRGMVLSAMRDGVILVAPDGTVAFANEAVSHHLGAIPSSLDGLLPLALREGVLTARREDGPVTLIVETGAPTRWLRATMSPALEEHILVVVRDVTEQRRLEAIRRDFVENASHELKTPAATIQATAETLRTAVEDDPAAVARFAAQLEREAIRLSRLVADLLDLSRLEGGSSLDELVSLSALASEECQRLEASAHDAGVGLELRRGADRPVLGSSRDLSLLVRNLVDNAIRYSGAGDQVLVEVDAGDHEVSLRVRDTGLGIPSKDMPRIFERFYRVDRGRSRNTGGTGLGLAIVKHVVENHGGHTTVDSELGRGSTFEVTLPVAPAAAAAMPRSREPA
jgi:signal transduction histidine kinase